MKQEFDFTTIMDRHGKDAIAIDGIGQIRAVNSLFEFSYLHAGIKFLKFFFKIYHKISV